MRTDQLALSRSATDRDAERRSEPGLLERLAVDPGCCWSTLAAASP